MLDLDAIEARAEAATPGPWIVSGGVIHSPIREPWDGKPNAVIVDAHIFEPNADFIAHARTDIPALVAELRAAREVVEAAAGFSAFMNEDAEDLQWPDEQLADLAAALAAYRAVVGEA
jgi:hypothetical protein